MDTTSRGPPSGIHSVKLPFSPLKINVWKMNFLLGPGLLSGANCWFQGVYSLFVDPRHPNEFGEDDLGMFWGHNYVPGWCLDV